MSEMFNTIATIFLVVDFIYLLFQNSRLKKENKLLRMKCNSMSFKIKELSDGRSNKNKESIEGSTTNGRDDC